MLSWMFCICVRLYANQAEGESRRSQTREWFLNKHNNVTQWPLKDKISKSGKSQNYFSFFCFNNITLSLFCFVTIQTWAHIWILPPEITILFCVFPRYIRSIFHAFPRCSMFFFGTINSVMVSYSIAMIVPSLFRHFLILIFLHIHVFLGSSSS